MSTPPPEQPSAYPYPYPNRQSPGGFGPAGPPVPPIPVRNNPYAQPSPYGPHPPGAPAIPQARTPSARGGAGRALLWAVVGAAVASAFWGGGVLLPGGGTSRGGKADLAGYKVQSDLCTASDISSFKGKYPQGDASPTHDTLRHPALDEMYCSEGLKMTGSTYSDAYLSIQMELHKKTDPAPEFTALWESYSQRVNSYKVEKVSGFGEEAFLVTQDTTSGTTGTTSGSRSATLAVRDGWVTYQMSWNAYLTTLDQSKNPPTVTEVADWLKTATTSTLRKLKR